MTEKAPSQEHQEQPEPPAAPQSPTDWIRHFRHMASEHEKYGNLQEAQNCRDRAKQLEDGLWAGFLEQWRESDRAKLRDWDAQWAHYRAWHIESLRGVFDFALASLKSFTLINAGAVVALLAFLGNVWGKGVNGAPFISALGIFAGGVFLSVLATGLAYISQGYASDENAEEFEKHAKLTNIGAIAIALLSLVLFAVGSWCSVQAFRIQPALREHPAIEESHVDKEPSATTAPPSKPAKTAGTAPAASGTPADRAVSAAQK